MTLHRLLAAVALGVIAFPALAAEPERAKDLEGFVPLFNGKDLAGWVNVNCHPSTFFVKDKEIITTGKPTGFLRTDRQYENFIIDFEWMHMNKTKVGNSGLFVWGDPIPATGTGYTRGIEVQVLVNLEYKDKKTGKVTATSHGDLFSIWGAKCKPDRPHPQGWSRCLPSEYRAKGGGEWNHYRVTANNGVIKLAVNGKEVSGVSECNPRKGYLALESEGAECHFRNLMIKELPSTNPKPAEVADVDRGFKNLYFGDLSGWKARAPFTAHWKPSDWKLVYDGIEEKVNTLVPRLLISEKAFGDFELIADWRVVPGKQKDDAVKRPAIVLRDGAPTFVYTPKKDNQVKAGEWNRYHVTMKGAVVNILLNGKPEIDKLKVAIVPKGNIGFLAESPAEFANIFIRELK